MTGFEPQTSGFGTTALPTEPQPLPLKGKCCVMTFAVTERESNLE